MTAKKKSKNKNKLRVSLALLTLFTISFKSCGIQPNSWQPPAKPKFELISMSWISLN